MRCRRLILSCLFSLFAFGWLGLTPARAPATPAGAPQKAEQASEAAPGVLKTETNLVLVDVIVTDKKGNYLRDMESKDFRVLEDDKEQPIASFSRPSDSSAPDRRTQPRYIVLFFDNSTMAAEEQLQARRAASQLIEKTASSERLMAVVDFGGTLRIGQNFTADVNSLKQAVAGVKFSAVQPNEPGQTTQIAALGSSAFTSSLVRVRSDFAARSVLLAIRSLSKTLRPVPGRKTLILFSGGFPLNPERESELTATIDAANKANVAIYSVDVRGLKSLGSELAPGVSEPWTRWREILPSAEDSRGDSSFPRSPALLAGLLAPPGPIPQQPAGQDGQAGGGAGSSGSGGGSTDPGMGAPAGAGGTSRTGNVPGASPTPDLGERRSNVPSGADRRGEGFPGGGPFSDPDPFGRGTAFGPNRRMFGNDPMRSIIPPMTESATTNQHVLYALATGTGGFAIVNTNDYTVGLTRIAQEVEEYYILGYVPPSQAHDGSYHRISVKVERKGTKVRARNGYYDVKSPDLLLGKPEGKILEAQATSPQPGDIPVTLSIPYFYTAPSVARVDLALEIPASALSFEKEKAKFHSEINVLGIAYREDNSVGARFSDTVKLDLEKKDLNDFSKGSFRYRNNFNIGPGKYNLVVVLSGGGAKFGKYQKPLLIEPFDGKTFQLSALALCNRMQPVSRLLSGMDVALLEERTPLVAQGMEMTPSSSNRFSRGEKVGLYVEVYAPMLLARSTSRVGLFLNVVDRKTNQRVFASNTVPVNSFAQEGNPVVPVGLLMPIEKLQPGDYRLEVLARDSAGNVSPVRTSDFGLD